MPEVNALKIIFNELSIPFVLFAFTYFISTLNTRLSEFFAFFSFFLGVVFIGFVMVERYKDGYKRRGY